MGCSIERPVVEVERSHGGVPRLSPEVQEFLFMRAEGNVDGFNSRPGVVHVSPLVIRLEESRLFINGLEVRLDEEAKQAVSVIFLIAENFAAFEQNSDTENRALLMGVRELLAIGSKRTSSIVVGLTRIENFLRPFCKGISPIRQDGKQGRPGILWPYLQLEDYRNDVFESSVLQDFLAPAPNGLQEGFTGSEVDAEPVDLPGKDPDHDPELEGAEAQVAGPEQPLLQAAVGQVAASGIPQPDNHGRRHKKRSARYNETPTPVVAKLSGESAADHFDRIMAQAASYKIDDVEGRVREMIKELKSAGLLHFARANFEELPEF